MKPGICSKEVHFAKRVCFALVLLFGGLLIASSEETAGSEIVLGQSAALSGPASSLGTEMEKGLRSYFNDVNANGGIDGRKVKLISYDDSYEPDKAIQNAKKLIDEDNVFLLIGEVGTPTSKVVQPIAKENRVPFVAPFTGAAFLRDDKTNGNVLNIRGSYNQEMERLVEYLHDKLGYDKIGIFYQNDSYGQAGLNGLELALKKKGLKIHGSGTYERNTTAVKKAILKLRKEAPQAIVMVGAYKACSDFIKEGRKIFSPDTVFCNISFVGSMALLNELGDQGEGVIISQVMPSPNNTSLALVKEYQDSLKRNYPDAKPDWTSLEGYLAAKFFTEVAKKSGKDMTRERFLEVAKGLRNYDFGGVSMTMGKDDNQGMDDVFLTEIKDGKIVDIEE